jgi:hypothetical protein
VGPSVRLFFTLRVAGSALQAVRQATQHAGALLKGVPSICGQSGRGNNWAHGTTARLPDALSLGPGRANKPCWVSRGPARPCCAMRRHQLLQGKLHFLSLALQTGADGRGWVWVWVWVSAMQKVANRNVRWEIAHAAVRARRFPSTRL